MNRYSGVFKRSRFGRRVKRPYKLRGFRVRSFKR